MENDKHAGAQKFPPKLGVA